MNKPDKHHIELFKAGENAPEALESAKQAFDFITALIHFSIIFPGIDSIALGGDNRHKAKIKRELAGFIALIGAIHQQIQRTAGRAEPVEQGAAFGRIVRLAWGQCEGYSRSSIRGNHMNLGAPSSARLADGLRAVFFKAPVPSG